MAIDLFTENKSSDRNRTQMFRQNSEMTPSNLSASEENFVYVTEISPVAAELRVLSQPVAGGSISHYPNYVYPTGGRSTYIYHVELGINEQHDDFRGRTIEWLYTDLSKATGADIRTEAAAGGGHSTCTASKAVGNLYGASRSATLVVVKMPNLDEASVLEVLDTVMDDIHDKHRTATSVVSISWGTKEFGDAIGQGGLPQTTLGLELFIQSRRLNKIGVPIICAAGNAALEFHGTQPRMFVDTVPAALAGQFSSTKFIVVGNSDINGMRYPTSQLHRPAYSETQVYAPGVNIKCASSTSSTGYETRTGTSFCKSLLSNP